ncbi:hypothetical protein GCM10010277_09880 [Streptomyces longisporoflavus]|nr:hypothetical protein GCM10010277_09880 [Streptomyces longisporoflavus]
MLPLALAVLSSSAAAAAFPAVPARARAARLRASGKAGMRMSLQVRKRWSVPCISTASGARDRAYSPIGRVSEEQS